MELMRLMRSQGRVYHETPKIKGSNTCTQFPLELWSRTSTVTTVWSPDQLVLYNSPQPSSAEGHRASLPSLPKPTEHSDRETDAGWCTPPPQL